MITRLARSGRGDQGATLILVLVLISVVSISSLAVLRLSEATLMAGLSAEQAAQRQADTTAAMDSQINAIRTSDYDNDVNAAQVCPPTQTVGPNLGGQYVTTCIPGQDTGAASGGTAQNANNTPASALLTVGTAAQDDGDGIERTGTGIFRINGQTYSRTDIRNVVGVGNAIELIGGQAFARGACIGTITSTPAVACNTLLNPAGSDDVPPPVFDQPTGGLIPRDVPTCGAGPVVEFQPGYYDDPVALNAVFTSCPTKIFWFKPESDAVPGRFYFDFKAGESPYFNPTTTPDALNTWTINNASIRMVAGKPLGWDPNGVNPNPQTFPGSCQSPLDTPNNGGVEFVFGGRSQLNVASGRVEICGRHYADQPSKAVFGATSSTPVPAEPEPTNRSTSGDGGCNVNFNNQGNIDYSDNVVATATSMGVAPANNACVTIDGFAPTVAIPKGSILRNATLVVRHREVFTGASFVVGFTPKNRPNGGGAGPTFNVTGLTRQANLTTQNINVTSQALFDEIRDFGYSSGTLDYRVNRTGGSGNAEIDTIQLVLDWIPPSVRAQDVPPIRTFRATNNTWTFNGTVKTGPGTTSPFSYSPAGRLTTATNCVGLTDFPDTGCAFLRTANSANARLYIQGTLYAPIAAVQLRQTNVPAPVVTNGTIVRKLDIQGLTAAGGYTGAILAVAPFSPPNVPLEVYAWTFQCTTDDAGLCYLDPIETQPGYPYVQSSLWTLVGTSRSRFTNGPGFPATQGNRDVLVQSWQYVSSYERP